jgi:hypothetical protein
MSAPSATSNQTVQDAGGLRARVRRQDWLYRPLRRAKLVVTRDLPRAGSSLLRPLGACGFPWSPPHGTYSLLPQPEEPLPATEGRVVLRNQGAPPVTDASLMVVCKLSQHQEQPWPIFWRRLPNARLSGPTLAVRGPDGRLGIESAYGKRFYQDDPAWTHVAGPRPTRLSGPWTSLISRWVPATGPDTNYAHWLFDALPRLAVLSEFPADTRILIPAKVLPFQQETLRLMGLADLVRPTAEHELRVEDYFFSSPTAMVVCYDPYGVAFLRRTFLPHARTPEDAPRRIFIARRGLLRSATNNQELEAFFTQRGWQVVDLAKLSFTEQVGLFANAEAVCGLHGAGFSNCVWCSPGVTVIELLADRYLSGCFEWLTGAVQGRHCYEIFPSDGNLCAHIDLNRLAKRLDKLGV